MPLDENDIRTIAQIIAEEVRPLRQEVQAERAANEQRFASLRAYLERLERVQNEHTMLLRDHSARLERVEQVQTEHTVLLNEHTVLLRDHTARLINLEPRPRKRSRRRIAPAMSDWENLRYKWAICVSGCVRSNSTLAKSLPEEVDARAKHRRR